jgi:hypothetical protein
MTQPAFLDPWSQIDWCGYDYDEWEINGRSIVSPREAQRARRWLHSVFERRTCCPFCQTPLLLATHNESPDLPEEYAEELYKLWYCKACAYWQWYSLIPPLNICSGTVILAVSAVYRVLNTDFPEGCFSEVAQFLRRNPKQWHLIEPKALEKIVAAVLKSNFQECEVTHVGRSSDQGIDVLMVDSSARQWFVQVKRRSKPGASEGFETLQKLLGTLYLKDNCFGMLFSTADHFTYHVHQHLGEMGQRGVVIHLANRQLLHRLLSPLLPVRPYSFFFESTHCFANQEIKDRLLSSMPAQTQECENQHKFTFWYDPSLAGPSP